MQCYYPSEYEGHARNGIGTVRDKSKKRHLIEVARGFDEALKGLGERKGEGVECKRKRLRGTWI